MMSPTLAKIFEALDGFNVAIVGSVLTKGIEAPDIDILFFSKEQFDQVCKAFDVKPITWHGYTGLVSRANIGVGKLTDKPLQFIWHKATTKPDEHPHIILLRDGTIHHADKVFEKVGGWKSDKTIKVSPKKEEGKVIAIDFDGTIRDWDTSQPLAGAKHAISVLREAGYKILIHSCNSPEWIENWMNDNDIRYDSIWTGVGKPIAYAYLDDRAVRFTDWTQALKDLTNGKDAGTEAGKE